MLGTVYETDYDTEVQFIPTDSYNEPVLKVVTVGRGDHHLSIEHAEALRDYLADWIEAANKQRSDGMPVNPPIDDSDIPF